MMKNIEKLTKVVQKNGKVRMLLMYAVANDCKESVTLSATDDYSTTLLSAVVEQNETLGLDDSQLDDCAAVILRTIESVDFNGTASKKDRLIALEAGIKSEITDGVKEILRSILESLDIEGIGKLSTDAVDSVVIWMMVRDVVNQIPVCHSTIKAATSYKKQQKQDKPSEDADVSESTTNMSSDEVQATIEKFATPKYGKIPYKKLSRKEKDVIQGIANILINEYENAKQSLIKEPLNDSLEKKAMDMAEKISEKIEMPNVLELVRDSVNECGDELTVEHALIDVLYSEFIVAMYGMVFPKGNKPQYSTLYNALKQPGFSSLIISDKYEDVKTEEAIKELAHIYAMNQAAEKESAVKHEITVSDVKTEESTSTAATTKEKDNEDAGYEWNWKEPKKKLSQMNFFERHIEIMREKRKEQPSEAKIALLKLAGR